MVSRLRPDASCELLGSLIEFTFGHQIMMGVVVGAHRLDSAVWSHYDLEWHEYDVFVAPDAVLRLTDIQIDDVLSAS